MLSPSTIHRAACACSCELGRVQGGSLKQSLVPYSGQHIVVSMATPAPSASGDGAVADGTPATDAIAAGGADQSVPAGRRRPRVVRPRIDIDDQILEANRVSELLKRMGQAAKNLKKAQTKAKQRLVKKAARLSPQDLERIAVLKRAFGETDDPEASDVGSSSSSLPSTSPPMQQGISAMHQSLKKMMTGVAGADDVVDGLGARVSQKDKRILSLAGQESASDEATLAAKGTPCAMAPKRLKSLKRLPAGVSEAIGSHAAHSEDSQSKED